MNKAAKFAALLLTGTMALAMTAGCQDTETGKDSNQQESGDHDKESEIMSDTTGTDETGTDGTESEMETKADSETAADSEPETQNTPEDIISNEEITAYGGTVVVGNSAYELFTYRSDIAEKYADAINRAADVLSGTADVYNIVIPLGSGITFPDNLKDQIDSSDQKKAVGSIASLMGNNVKEVPIYDALMQHRTEYIYFRTDHHWTPLGAYYAYEQFCLAKGIVPEDINSYKTVDFDNFVGSFYNDTKDSRLSENPDTIHAYYPNCEASMHVTDKDGSEYDWMVIYDVSDYNKGIKYSTFIAGDNPYTVITNKSLTDGSSCIVVKESFGNAFVPFLVDHYQTIYVIDYRYWEGSLFDLVQTTGASDVIFANNLSMIRNSYLVGQLQGIID